jgi:uncharacterized membrane protein
VGAEREVQLDSSSSREKLIAADGVEDSFHDSFQPVAINDSLDAGRTVSTSRSTVPTAEGTDPPPPGYDTPASRAVAARRPGRGNAMPRLKTVMRFTLGGLFILAGILHFLNPDMYLRIMPPYLPWHPELVAVSGAFEVVLGVLLLIRRTVALAAWGLIALLIAVFPANIHMAINTGLYNEYSPVAIWIRLPLQGVLIAWAYWFTRPVR